MFLNPLQHVLGYASWMNKIRQGRLVDAVVSVYTDSMGDFFFASVFGVVFIAMFIKSKSTILPVVVFLTTASVTLYMLPWDTHPFIYLVLALELALVLTRAFMSR